MSSLSSSWFRGLCGGVRLATSTTFLRSSLSHVEVRAVSTAVDTTGAETVNRLDMAYRHTIVPLLLQHFSYSNIHQVPKVEKVVVNCGIGQNGDQGLDIAVNDLALITGQMPMLTQANKAIPGFKFREQQIFGISVTLRGNVMYSFLDRLINSALPRVRDFQGVHRNSFDGHGNYTIGFPEKAVFSEISPDIVGKARGLDVCIKTTAETDEEAHKLLALMGMPFREDGVQLSL